MSISFGLIKFLQTQKYQYNKNHRPDNIIYVQPIDSIGCNYQNQQN